MVFVARVQDKYILSSMAMLCSVCLWHAIVPLIHSRLVDVVVMATLACIYLLSHLAFYIFIYIVVSFRQIAQHAPARQPEFFSR